MTSARILGIGVTYCIAAVGSAWLSGDDPRVVVFVGTHTLCLTFCLALKART